jgi:predicted O-methyltransferase YrrM
MDKPPLDSRRMDNNPDESNLDNPDESNLLYGLDDLCKKYINKRMSVLELGSKWGVSTALFCYYAGYVVAVDTWYSTGIKKLKTEAGNLFFRKGDISVILPAIKSKRNIRFDFIYIDADHEYKNVKRDIELSTPLLKEGGIIGGHDFAKPHVGVIKAVTEKWEHNQIEVFKDTSWVIKGEKAK